MMLIVGYLKERQPDISVLNMNDRRRALACQITISSLRVHASFMMRNLHPISIVKSNGGQNTNINSF